MENSISRSLQGVSATFINRGVTTSPSPYLKYTYMRKILLVLLALFFFRCVVSAQPVTVSTGNVSITVDLSTGARVVSCKADDRELLGSSAIHPRFYGSSLWLSPEGKWKGMGALDTRPYVVRG